MWQYYLLVLCDWLWLSCRLLGGRCYPLKHCSTTEERQLCSLCWPNTTPPVTTAVPHHTTPQHTTPAALHRQRVQQTLTVSALWCLPSLSRPKTYHIRPAQGGQVLCNSVLPTQNNITSSQGRDYYWLKIYFKYIIKCKQKVWFCLL